MPVGLAASDRLYVMGNRPGCMESIGPEEHAWRREPSVPSGDGPLAGASLENKLYVMMPNAGLGIFDPSKGYGKPSSLP